MLVWVNQTNSRYRQLLYKTHKCGSKWNHRQLLASQCISSCPWRFSLYSCLLRVCVLVSFLPLPCLSEPLSQLRPLRLRRVDESQFFSVWKHTKLPDILLEINFTYNIICIPLFIFEYLHILVVVLKRRAETVVAQHSCRNHDITRKAAFDS